MQIEEAIYGAMTGEATISALVGTRIYPGQAPQSSAFPVVIYQQASQKKVMSLTGVVNLNSYSLHLDIWGETYASVKAVYHAIREFLNGYRGALGAGTVNVRGVFEEGGDDQAESPIHAEEEGLFRAGLDLSIWYGN